VKATYVAGLALLLLVAGRWAHGQPALNTQTVTGGAFVLLVLAALDGGRTEDIARGMAWILLAVVALSNNSPLTAIARAANGKVTGKAPATSRGGPSA